MKFLKAKAADSLVLEGSESELTMLSRLREYCALAASCLRADSAAEAHCLLEEGRGQREQRVEFS